MHRLWLSSCTCIFLTTKHIFQSLQVEAFSVEVLNMIGSFFFFEGALYKFFKERLSYLVTLDPPPHPESIQAIPSPTDVPTIMPTSWNNCVESICAELWPWWHQPLCLFGLKLENSLHLPLSAQ